jgi:hypothetical protein
VHVVAATGGNAHNAMWFGGFRGSVGTVVLGLTHTWHAMWF